MKKLENKKAIVIGGSSGINKEVARSFLVEGAEVLLVASNKDRLDTAKKDLSSNGAIEIFVADVSSAKDMKKLADHAAKEWKNIDILVNGAAIQGPIGPTTETDPEEWVNSIRITLVGTYHGIRFLGPLVSRGGSIINYVGGGEGPLVNQSSYVASKGGIARLNETVAAELKDREIRVNAVAPGAVNTKFLQEVLNAGPEKAGQVNYERALKQKENGGVPPEKAAQLCVWLASDESRGVTGKIISAQWDPYLDLPKHLEDLSNTDVYTMRRVKPKDRGFDLDPLA